MSSMRLLLIVCELASAVTISPEDFSQNVAAGQTLELSFIGKQKIDNMPTYTTWEGFYYMVDFYDNYLIDHNGNNLILKG